MPVFIDFFVESRANISLVASFKWPVTTCVYHSVVPISGRSRLFVSPTSLCSMVTSWTAGYQL